MGKHQHAIHKMSNRVYDQSEVAHKAFKSIVKSTLDTALISYTNKSKETDYLDSYLYGALKVANQKIINESRVNTLICPGCRENNQIEVLSFVSDGLCCVNCHREMSNPNTPENHLLHNTFANHSIVGFKCPTCSKFIPEKSGTLRCPYKGCNFEGLGADLQRMYHPQVKIQREGSALNLDKFADHTAPSVTVLSAQEDVDLVYRIINECIDAQVKVLHFRGFQATYVIKLCMYKAFKSSLDKFPDEIIPYLSRVGKSTGRSRVQSKIFQEFTIHLENSLPFSFLKNEEECHITSILDQRLKIFDGESVFQAKVNNKFEIPNLTNETYIGSRSSYYCLPFYIGKLIEVKELTTNQSILNKVREYSCTKINMDPHIVESGTQVEVKHLRIIPHYMMGGFVTLNRQKKLIAEKVQSRLQALK